MSNTTEDTKSLESNKDPESDQFFSLTQESTDKEDAEVYVPMEMVSLETSADAEAMNVHFQIGSTSSESAGSKEDPLIEKIPGTEVHAMEQTALLEPKEIPTNTSTVPLSLSRYFEETSEPKPVQDTMGHNFFDSLTSGLSPMMKSVTDITSLDVGVEVAEVATEASDIGPSVPSPDNSPLSEQTTPVIETSPQELGATEETTVTQSLEDITTESVSTKPLLSALFSEDKSGSDVVGKAFFDSLAGSLVIGQADPALPLSASSGPRSPDLLFLDPQEKDQFYDAWIPSARTRDVLVAMVTSSQGSFFPEKRDLTMPGIIIKDIMADPVKILMSELGLEEAQARSCLTADHVQQDETGLRQLMQAKCFGAAINLTGRLLSAIGQGLGRTGHPSRHSPYSLQLWYTRLALFVKLRKFHSAETESHAFGDLDKPDIYYEFYPDVFTGRKGSMAPFSFRLLIAECPQYQGNYNGALDRLYALLAIVQKIFKNLENGLAEDGGMIDLSEHHRKASLKLWRNRENRILHSILNCMVAQKDFVMAIGVAELMLRKNPTKAAEIQSALGRVYLQLGDVQSASTCFNQVAFLRSQQAPNIKYAVEDLVHKALMCIVQNSYADAYKYFNEALILDPGNPVLTNNMSVCLLYMGRLKEALSLVEGTVVQGEATKRTNLHEGLLFNMCILYELESFYSDRKKLNTLKTVAQNVGDSFQTACLKIDVKAILERK